MSEEKKTTKETKNILAPSLDHALSAMKELHAVGHAVTIKPPQEDGRVMLVVPAAVAKLVRVAMDDSEVVETATPAVFAKRLRKLAERVENGEYIGLEATWNGVTASVKVRSAKPKAKAE